LDGAFGMSQAEENGHEIWNRSKSEIGLQLWNTWMVVVIWY